MDNLADRERISRESGCERATSTNRRNIGGSLSARSSSRYEDPTTKTRFANGLAEYELENWSSAGRPRQ